MINPFITEADAIAKDQVVYNSLKNEVAGAVSGFRGIIMKADTKTEDGVYSPGESGTFPEAGGLTYLPEVDFSSGGDKGYDVKFIKSGAVWTKSQVELSSSYLDAWVPTSYPIGSQKTHGGKLWGNPNSAAAAGDVPGVSTKWEVIIDGGNKDVFQLSISNFKEKGSFIDTNGLAVENAGKENTGLLLLDRNEPIFVKANATATRPLVYFYNELGNPISGIYDASKNNILTEITTDNYPEGAYYFKASSDLGGGLVRHMNANQLNTKLIDISKDGVDMFIYGIRYLDYSGNTVLNAAAKITPFLPINKKSKIRLVGVFGNPSQSSIVFYDKRHVFISKLTDSGTVDLNDSNIPDSTAYFRANAKTIDATKIIGIIDFGASINEDQNYFLSKKGFYTNDGEFTEDEGYRSTEILPITEGIVYEAFSNGSQVQPVLFFDSDKQPLTPQTFESSPLHTVDLHSIAKPVGTEFFAINTRATYRPKVFLNIEPMLTKNVSAGPGDTSNFVLKEPGKGLSTNDYSTLDKNKVTKLEITGTGTKALFNDGLYKAIGAGGEPIEPIAEIEYTNIQNNSQSRPLIKRPLACLTFDDGYEYDYTDIKPLLESYGVKGTFYLNELNVPNKMTDAQVLDMYANGHELGVHTRDHTILSKRGIKGKVDIGDTHIRVINTSPTGSNLNIGTGLVVQFRTSSGAVFNITETALEDSSTILMTLETPSTVDVPLGKEIWITEKSVYDIAKLSKDAITDLGIDVTGIAYPYGSITDEGKRAVQRLFNYGRDAVGSYKGDDSFFSGFKENIQYPFDQFRIVSTELIVLSDTQMDTLIDKCISRGAVLNILAHGSSGSGMLDKLETFIQKCQAKGLNIVTVKEALVEHGDMLNLNDFKVNALGHLFGGVSALTEGYMKVGDSGLKTPNGISMTRITSVEVSDGYAPETGVLINFNTGEFKSKWSFQILKSLDNDRLYLRRYTSNALYSRWKIIGGDNGNSFPTTDISIGESFYRRDLNKPFWFKGAGKWVDAMGTEI